MNASIMMMYIFGFVTRVLLPLILGIYVFWDAGRRGMKRVLWAAVVLLVPSFIGFVIYLLARGSNRMRCPKCSSPVQAKDVTCPKCGAHLHPVCEKCGAVVEEDFKVCPYCASPLANALDTVTPPEREKERGLGKLIAAMIVIPLVLILAVWAVSAIGEAGNGSTNLSFTETAFYLEMIDNPEIEQWIDGCHEDGKAYILRYRDENANGEKRFWYLVYVPSWEGDSSHEGWDNESKNGVFGKKITVDLYDRGGERGSAIFVVRAARADVRSLKIYLDGELLENEITDVDYRLGLFDIISDDE